MTADMTENDLRRAIGKWSKQEVSEFLDAAQKEILRNHAAIDSFVVPLRMLRADHALALASFLEKICVATDQFQTFGKIDSVLKIFEPKVYAGYAPEAARAILDLRPGYVRQALKEALAAGPWGGGGWLGVPAQELMQMMVAHDTSSAPEATAQLMKHKNWLFPNRFMGRDWELHRHINPSLDFVKFITAIAPEALTEEVVAHVHDLRCDDHGFDEYHDKKYAVIKDLAARRPDCFTAAQAATYGVGIFVYKGEDDAVLKETFTTLVADDRLATELADSGFHDIADWRYDRATALFRALRPDMIKPTTPQQVVKAVLGSLKA